METEAVKYHVTWGLAFVIVAEFADTEEGDKLSNAYMLEHPGIGVLEVIDGRVILASKTERGTVVPRPCSLLCSCCGSVTRGRQWHNRDKGFGLCARCIDFCSRNTTAEDFRRCYGDRGVHFDLPAGQ